MDLGNMLSDSFEYTKEALMEKWLKWILLIIPFMTQGYEIQIFKGTKPAPEINDWVINFINGIKLAIVGLIYALPIIIIAGILFLGAILALISGDPRVLMTAAGGAVIGVLICVVWAIILLFIVPFAFIRFARTDKFGEAFNISAILAHLGKIGWIAYVIALVVLLIMAIIFGIIVSIISTVLMFIPLIGGLLNFIFQLILMPPVGIFSARYLTQVYDAAGPA
ncbi:MAG: DUF4013 domain-containing protein [Methanoregula sp.]|nr:DUF4013 domain-containing protein [Methanoregula sp.]